MNKSQFKTALIIFFAFSMLACTKNEKPWKSLKSISVGNVNNEIITRNQFENAYIEYLIRTGANDTELNRLGVWESLVDAVLLSNFAAEKGLINESNNQSLDLYAARRASREWLTDQVDVEMKPLGESDKKRAFYRSKTKLNIRQLFFRSPSKADSIFQKLENKEDFVDLANQLYHTEKYDSSAGLIGEIDYLNTDDAFADVAYSLEINQYSKPFRTAHGWHIIRVENQFTQPIITESEFSVKEQGISNLEFARKKRVKANETIRAIMEKTNPKLRADGVQKLQELLAGLPSIYTELEQKHISRSVSEYDINQLNPEIASMPLSDWSPNNSAQIFLLSDYWKWIPYLSVTEAKQRIGLSIGKAMRNEMLAKIAVEEGYLENPLVSEERKRAFWLSGMKVALSNLESKSITEEEKATLVELFEKSRFNRPIDFEVEYRMNEIDSKNARSLKNLDVYKSEVENWKKVELSTSKVPVSLKSILQKSPLNQVLLAVCDEKPVLIYISKRNPIFSDYKTFIENQGAELWQYKQQVETLRNLRKEAKISLDSVAFWQNTPFGMANKSTK